MDDVIETNGGGVYYAPYKPSLWRRLGWQTRFDEDLFNWRNLDPPEEGFAPGCITTNVTIHVSFIDRLRLLITGRALLSVYTKTSVEVERAVSRSQFSVLSP